MYRDGKGGTEMRLGRSRGPWPSIGEYSSGKTPEHYAKQDYKWVPHQVRKGDLVLIHDMVRSISSAFE